MESMRDVLRRSLGRSLESLPALDRLEAAWPVACGVALAGRGRIVGYAERTVRVEVEDVRWLQEMLRMRSRLAGELARVAGVPVDGIHFEQAAAAKR